MSEHDPEANPEPAPAGSAAPSGRSDPAPHDGVGTGAPAEGEVGSSSSDAGAGSPAGSAPPPAGALPPPPSAALPPPPVASPPPATAAPGPAPEAGKARSGPFGGVLAAGIVTLLVLALVSLWDGGSTGSASPSAPPVVGGGGSGSTVGVPGSAGADDGSDSSSSGSSSVAFNPMALQPPGGVQVPPSDSGVNLEWSVRGTSWRVLRERYRARFPVPGYKLGDQRMGYGEADDNGQGFDIVPTGGSSIDSVGVLSFHDDPSGSGAVLVSYLAR